MPGTPPANPFSSSATNPFYASVISQLNARQQPPSYSSGMPDLNQLLQSFQVAGG